MTNNTNNYLDQLSQLFSNAKHVSKEEMTGFMEETMAFFRKIKAKLESKDPAEQQEAFDETMEMRRILESKIKSICELTGMNPEQLAELAANPNNISAEEKSMFDSAKAKLRQIQDVVEPPKKNNNSKQKIIG